MSRSYTAGEGRSKALGPMQTKFAESFFAEQQAHIKESQDYADKLRKEGNEPDARMMEMSAKMNAEQMEKFEREFLDDKLRKEVLTGAVSGEDKLKLQVAVNRQFAFNKIARELGMRDGLKKSDLTPDALWEKHGEDSHETLYTMDADGNVLTVIKGTGDVVSWLAPSLTNNAISPSRNWWNRGGSSFHNHPHHDRAFGLPPSAGDFSSFIVKGEDKGVIGSKEGVYTISYADKGRWQELADKLPPKEFWGRAEEVKSNIQAVWDFLDYKVSRQYGDGWQQSPKASSEAVKAFIKAVEPSLRDLGLKLDFKPSKHFING